VFRKVVAAVFVSLSAIFFMVAPISATYADPTSISIASAKVFQNVFQANDMLFVMFYNVAYASPPTDAPSDLFYMNLYDTNGVLLYSRGINYYQYNVNAIYLTAAQAASLTWGSAYNFKLTANPSKVSSLVLGTNYVAGTLDPNYGWVTGTLATTPGLLQSYLTTQLAPMNVALTAMTPTNPILITTGSNQVLNTNGSLYLKTAIPGIDAICPTLFQVASNDITNPTYTATGALGAGQSVSGTLGSATDRGITALSSWFSISYNMAGGIVLGVMAIAFMVILFKYSGSTTASMILVVPVLLIGAWTGLLSIGILFTLAILVAAYMVYALWLRGI
jgi:hypothetical protein